MSDWIQEIKEYIYYYYPKIIKLGLKGLNTIDYRNQALVAAQIITVLYIGGGSKDEFEVSVCNALF